MKARVILHENGYVKSMTRPDGHVSTIETLPSGKLRIKMLDDKIHEFKPDEWNRLEVDK